MNILQNFILHVNILLFVFWDVFLYDWDKRYLPISFCVMEHNNTPDLTPEHMRLRNLTLTHMLPNWHEATYYPHYITSDDIINTISSDVESLYVKNIRSEQRSLWKLILNKIQSISITVRDEKGNVESASEICFPHDVDDPFHETLIQAIVGEDNHTYSKELHKTLLH